MENQIKEQQWQYLILAAKESYNKAYAPYSNFKVGAAALTEKQQVVSGCNVENASYGLTVCAERNCIAQAVIGGETALSALVVYTEQEDITPPCGACRQVIAEFFPQDGLIKAVNHLGDEINWQVCDLLPNAFTPKNLLNAKD